MACPAAQPSASRLGILSSVAGSLGNFVPCLCSMGIGCDGPEGLLPWLCKRSRHNLLCMCDLGGERSSNVVVSPSLFHPGSALAGVT